MPHLYDWVPYDFYTEYQRDAVKASRRAGSFHLIHPPGCLTGETQIVVNRGGCARRTRLDRLVFKFNGGAEARDGRCWNLGIPTFVSSVSADGFGLKVRVLEAFDNGTDYVFELRTETRRIQATGKHRFYPELETPAALSSLRVGDQIACLVDPKPGPRAKKAQYREVLHMESHPGHVKRWRSRQWTFTVPEHRLVMEADLNGLSLDTFVGRILLKRLDSLQFLGDEVHVHHRNRDTSDNRLQNLEIIEAKDHARRHGLEGGWKHVAQRVKYERILSIRPIGERRVYDLSVDHPRSQYVANGFIVHNSGKTAASVGWMFATASGKNPRVRAGPTVVVTRANVREKYAKEIRRLSDARVQTLYGEGGKESTELDPAAHVYVLNYDILPYWVETLIHLSPESVVFDEIHKASSWKRDKWVPTEDGNGRYEEASNIAAACKRLSVAAARRLGMTATPIRNRRDGLWAQLDLVHPGTFGSYFQFTKLFCAATHNAYGGWDARGTSNDLILERRLSAVRHVVNYDVVRASLPPLRRMITRLDPEELSRGVDKKREAASLQKHLGYRRGALEYQLLLTAGRKHRYVLETLEEEVLTAKAKAVVFTGRRKDCDELGVKVQKLVEKVSPGAWIRAAHGEADSRKREEIAAEFLTTPPPAVLVATGDSFGEGCDLHDADRAFFCMLPWTPSQIEQWEGRFIRQGMQQKPHVIIEYVIAKKTVDDHVADIVLSKLSDVDRLVGNGAVGNLHEALSGASEEEILEQLARKIGAVDVEDE